MDVWALVLLAGLGAYHGINPAMGWLFAVALGHELAIVLVAVLVLGLGLLADSSALHLGAGIALIAFGVFRFVKPRAHPRWTTMRVNRAELTWWSFLMSSAHGAGLMVAPILIGASTAEAGASDHALEAVRNGTMSIPESGIGILLHVGAMVAVMGVIAVIVYEHVGVAVLRKAWINLDGVWAAAFVVAGVLTLIT